MKRGIIFQLLGISLLIFLPLISQATKIENPLTAQSFESLIDTLISFIVTIGVVVAPIVILYAGFLFMTSGGEPDKVKMAKNLILYCLIGLGILLLGKGLISVIKDIFQVKGP
jgi:hypothetical protein